jgi:hypothetical protein
MISRLFGGIVVLVWGKCGFLKENVLGSVN